MELHGVSLTVQRKTSTQHQYIQFVLSFYAIWNQRTFLYIQFVTFMLETGAF